MSASRQNAETPLSIPIDRAKTLPTGARPQLCPIFGRGVPKTAIAPTTSSQNGSTPTPGTASRTSPGKKQPLPAQHDEQQRGSHDIDRPSDRRRQARESTNDIGYTSNDEGECKSQ